MRHAAAGLALIDLVPSAPAKAAEVDMNLAHFMPPTTRQHQELLTVWAETVAE